MIKVIGLHDHIVEFQEGKALFHALLVAFGAQHIVHREARAHLAQQLNIVEIQQPVGVIDHDGLALAEVDEALHLLLEAFGVVVDVLRCQHLAHVGTAGWIPDHGSSAAD